ncbi:MULTISPECIES: DUF6602 domain-containing protein [unclassified Dysgonomonas]|jgi:hypothetical protein|uniref:DUF6602 domain-containing protein n=1 Tax=unclassified Dysgonomonas TaxID=2630389 RepID=UPI0025C58C50|nr:MULTISPECIES: DUF6602 domain-containing protein [unclassified Dysgonomonas]MDR2002880.1 hypothetical protein [Prevotella sp.]HMM04424.1 hypothetical protein [Dysgonomonas sp.]
MPNSIFQEIIKSDISTLKLEASAINSVKHEGLKGNIREYGFGKFLSKYLPNEWEVGSGQIQDYQGNQSSETDILLYNNNHIPPILFGNKGFYPIECVSYAIEVKTTSTATEIKTTIDKFKKLQELRSMNNNPQLHRLYFALDSDLTKETELERYKKYDSSFYTDPSITIILVIGKGYWYYNRQVKDNKWYGYWSFQEASIDNYEVAMLLGGMINTLNQGKPQFGYYILPDGNFKIVDSKEI